VGPADLSLAFVAPQSFVAGVGDTFQLRVTNKGPNAAVPFIDINPSAWYAMVSSVTATHGGRCQGTSPTRCQFGTLPAGVTADDHVYGRRVHVCSSDKLHRERHRTCASATVQ
jgi:hypothetical protein